MCSAVPAGHARDVALVLCGAAIFYAGFHLVVAALLLFAWLAWTQRAVYLRTLCVVAGGIGVGMASWLAVLATQGLVKKFFLMLLGSPAHPVGPGGAAGAAG